jgi:hypothetical protein
LRCTQPEALRGLVLCANGCIDKQVWSIAMGNKIVTEADRRRTPAPRPTEGSNVRREGTGQRVSLERGTATRNKKNPGKRPHKGG